MRWGQQLRTLLFWCHKGGVSEPFRILLATRMTCQLSHQVLNWFIISSCGRRLLWLAKTTSHKERATNLKVSELDSELTVIRTSKGGAIVIRGQIFVSLRSKIEEQWLEQGKKELSRKFIPLMTDRNLTKFFSSPIGTRIDALYWIEISNWGLGFQVLWIS